MSQIEKTEGVSSPNRDVHMKIKGIVVDYESPSMGREDSQAYEMAKAALFVVHEAMVRKAWIPIVTALQATGEAGDDLPELIALWASRYALGDRSKKLKALKEKKAKAYVEEKLKEMRFSVTEARKSGLVAASVEEMFEKGDGTAFFEEAEAELSPGDLLEPVAVTMEEVKELRREKEARDD